METISIPEIGDVVILHTYAYYDGPRLFCCEDLKKQKYLSICVEINDNFDRWFYVPMSDGRIQAVHSGSLSLYEANKHPEVEYIWNIVNFFNGDSKSALLNIEDIPEEDLPSEEALIDGNEDGFYLERDEGCQIKSTINQDIEHSNDITLNQSNLSKRIEIDFVKTHKLLNKQIYKNIPKIFNNTYYVHKRKNPKLKRRAS